MPLPTFSYIRTLCFFLPQSQRTITTTEIRVSIVKPETYPYMNTITRVCTTNIRPPATTAAAALVVSLYYTRTQKYAFGTLCFSGIVQAIFLYLDPVTPT